MTSFAKAEDNIVPDKVLEFVLHDPRAAALTIRSLRSSAREVVDAGNEIVHHYVANQKPLQPLPTRWADAITEMEELL